MHVSVAAHALVRYLERVAGMREVLDQERGKLSAGSASSVSDGALLDALKALSAEAFSLVTDTRTRIRQRVAEALKTAEPTQDEVFVLLEASLFAVVKWEQQGRRWSLQVVTVRPAKNAGAAEKRPAIDNTGRIQRGLRKHLQKKQRTSRAEEAARRPRRRRFESEDESED